MLWLSVQFLVLAQGKGTYSDTVDVLEFYIADLDDPTFLNVIWAQIQGLGGFAASSKFIKRGRLMKILMYFGPCPWVKERDVIPCVHYIPQGITESRIIMKLYVIVQCQLSYYKKNKVNLSVALTSAWNYIQISLCRVSDHK